MKLFVGLGNPGAAFWRTRHNAGFMIVNAIHSKWKVVWEKNTNQGILAKVKMEDREILTLKPTTFMNESGRSVASVLASYKIFTTDMIVIHDDLELPLAKVKIKNSGSAGGHNGVKSIIGNVGEQFFRLRFGIGRPDSKDDVAQYVLEKFHPGEISIVESGVQMIAECSHLLAQPDLFMKELNSPPGAANGV